MGSKVKEFASCRLVLLLILALTVRVESRTADEWKSRVIYQLLTDRFAQDSDSSGSCSDLSDYCGGKFNGIARKLDYIQGLGANAIWISPIPDNTDKGYHGYWQKNITEINSNFGTSDDLKKLVAECHSRDIWVMLDVVGNHMGNQNYGDWSNFAKFYPFNQGYHYHPYCLITDFNDQHQVEVCRLANLPDLDQSNSYVRSTLKNWIHSTIETYGFDGIRIDTTPEVPKDFWSEYTQSAGVFSIGEVFNGNPQYVAGYQGPENSLLNYPMYYKLLNAFQERQTMRNIHDGVTANMAAFQDVSVLGNFLDNHDNPRFLSKNSDYNTLKNALAYIIFAEGIPIIYYGTEQGFNGNGDPNNRESLWPHYNTNSDLYRFTGQLASFRSKQGSSLWESKQIERYVDDQFFAFTRNNVFVATTNSDNSLSRTITYHPYQDGTVLQNLLDSNDKVTVNGGKFTVSMNALPKVYSPASSLQLGVFSDDLAQSQPDATGDTNINKKNTKIDVYQGVVTGVSVGVLLLIGLVLTVVAYVLRRRAYRAYTYLNLK